MVGAGNLFTGLSIFQSSLVLILTPTLPWCTKNSRTPWRKTLPTPKTIKHFSNFRYHATTSIHPVALIHKVHCQVSWHHHRKQVMHRFFFPFCFNLCCHSKLQLSSVEMQVAKVSSSHLPTCPGSICHRGNGSAQV